MKAARLSGEQERKALAAEMQVIQTLQYGLVEQQSLLMEQEFAKYKQTQEEQQHALAQQKQARTECAKI